jgi:hypothetical protein
MERGAFFSLPLVGDGRRKRVIRTQYRGDEATNF